MGSCCSKKATILSAFPQELGTPLLKELAPKLNRHARVVTIQLMSLHNIVTVPGSFVTATNAFVEFRLRPEDEMTGEQRQTSSIRPATVRPEWTPPESFQFVVLDMKKSRVLLSVYHHNPDLPMAPLPIGDCVLHTDGLKLSSTGTQHTIPLINPSNGQKEGTANLKVTVLTVREASEKSHECVYEYEEYSLAAGAEWQMMTMPGRWSTNDGKSFADDLEELSTPLPAGWEVSESWTVVGSQEDPDGWQYASTLDSPYWFDETGSGLYFRRRSWSRLLAKKVKGSKK